MIKMMTTTRCHPSQHPPSLPSLFAINRRGFSASLVRAARSSSSDMIVAPCAMDAWNVARTSSRLGEENSWRARGAREAIRVAKHYALQRMTNAAYCSGVSMPCSRTLVLSIKTMVSPSVIRSTLTYLASSGIPEGRSSATAI